jgi:glycosyltransferase involved in cell wall biosynthesis
MSSKKVVLLHDAFDFMGGGERLVKTLCEDLNLDLALGNILEESFDLSGLSGNLINLEASSSIPLLRTLKRFHAFFIKTRFLQNYETVIYSGQNAPLAIRNHSGGKNILYCFTPPRSIYDLHSVHLAALSPSNKLAHKIYNLFFKPLYENAVHKMDHVVAISNTTKKRIKSYLNIDAPVIYPPCDTEYFQWKGQGDYYLSTARLSPYKRVDLIIQAFSNLPHKKLLVTSSGSDMDKLKILASDKKNIVFTGSVSDQELKALIGNAIATIYIPKDEDFGISPVESMAAGKPVVGVSEGGLQETILEGETGFLINSNPSQQDLIQAIETLSPKKALLMRGACQSRAQVFGREVFIEKFKNLIN